MPPFNFNPTDGYRNMTSFPTKPPNETVFRDSMQKLLDQIKDFINQNMIPTSGDRSYYVNAATGNDSNDGLTSGTAFKTIQAAINKLPQIVNHVITVTVAAGTYNETLNISGFMGGGQIIVNGANALAATHNLNDVFLNKVQIPVSITGFNCTSTTTDGFTALSCNAVAAFVYCRSVQAAVGNGFYIYASRAKIAGSQVANRSVGNALLATELSFVLCIDETTGTGNSTGLQASGGATIRKSGTQFSGTTAEYAQTGGVIS